MVSRRKDALAKGTESCCFDLFFKTVKEYALVLNIIPSQPTSPQLKFSLYLLSLLLGTGTLLVYFSDSLTAQNYSLDWLMRVIWFLPIVISAWALFLTKKDMKQMLNRLAYVALFVCLTSLLLYGALYNTLKESDVVAWGYLLLVPFVYFGLFDFAKKKNVYISAVPLYVVPVMIYYLFTSHDTREFLFFLLAMAFSIAAAMLFRLELMQMYAEKMKLQRDKEIQSKEESDMLARERSISQQHKSKVTNLENRLKEREVYISQLTEALEILKRNEEDLKKKVVDINNQKEKITSLENEKKTTKDLLDIQDKKIKQHEGKVDALNATIAKIDQERLKLKEELNQKLIELGERDAGFDIPAINECAAQFELFRGDRDYENILEMFRLFVEEKVHSVEVMDENKYPFPRKPSGYRVRTIRKWCSIFNKKAEIRVEDFRIKLETSRYYEYKKKCSDNSNNTKGRIV